MGDTFAQRSSAARERMALILVVEDEPSIRHLVRAILEVDDYEISEAEDGTTALDQLRQRRPDLVLLDLSLPDMDGWTFLERCRAEPNCCDVPVVVLSAVARPPGRSSMPSQVRHFL